MASKTPPPIDDNAQSVGKIVEYRMDHLGLSQEELSDRSRVSTSTIRKVKYGLQSRYQGPTLTALSRALGWPPDTLARLLREGYGGERDYDDLISYPDPSWNEAAESLPSERGIPAALGRKLERLTTGQRRAIENLVDEMLGSQ